jgi:hypothetical protein
MCSYRLFVRRGLATTPPCKQREHLGANKMAKSRGLHGGWTLDDVFAYFHMRWDIGHNGPDLEEFVEDEGELEDAYPGAPEYACWLHDLRERSHQLQGHERESPIEPYIDPQGLF